MRTMTFLQILLSMVVLTTFSISSQAQIKSWINKDGVREFGKTVPPEYAQKGHKELSEQGTLIKEQERVKTEEELVEAAKAAELAAEEKRLEQDRRKEDSVLIATYTKADDIEMVKQERIQVIESNVKVIEKRTETIQLDLNKRMKTAADAERAGNTPNDALLKDIESLQRQIKTNNAYIEGKREEKEKTKSEFDAKIARFIELRGNN